MLIRSQWKADKKTIVMTCSRLFGTAQQKLGQVGQVPIFIDFVDVEVGQLGFRCAPLCAGLPTPHRNPTEGLLFSSISADEHR